MPIDSRKKGIKGEQEIANLMNGLVAEVRDQLGLSVLESKDRIFQRNQNQTAVGGYDLSNSLFLAIEVKRGESLYIDKWWEQCMDQAKSQGHIPVLLFRQNRKAWRCCMQGGIYFHPATDESTDDLVMGPVRVEVTINSFKEWFRAYYNAWLSHIA